MILLRAVAYLAIAGVAASLWLEGAQHLGWMLLALGVFAAALPMWPWIRRIGPEAFFALALAEGILVAACQFLSGQPGTLMLLYFVLLPTCARLPRKYSLLCYLVFPLAACLPYLGSPDPRTAWSVVAGVVPGFLASIAFAEGYWSYRDALVSNQKLLDEVIEAQRLQAAASEATAPDPARAAEILTRRDREVLALVARGFSNKEIAERLFLAEGTVKNRVSLVLDKIGARDRTQAALRARDWGVI